MKEKPFYEQLPSYSVRDSNFEELAQCYDDDSVIVDIDTDGGSKMIRNRKEIKNLQDFENIEGFFKVTTCLSLHF